MGWLPAWNKEELDMVIKIQDLDVLNHYKTDFLMSLNQYNDSYLPNHAFLEKLK